MFATNHYTSSFTTTRGSGNSELPHELVVKVFDSRSRGIQVSSSGEYTSSAKKAKAVSERLFPGKIWVAPHEQAIVINDLRDDRQVEVFTISRDNQIVSKGIFSDDSDAGFILTKGALGKALQCVVTLEDREDGRMVAPDRIQQGHSQWKNVITSLRMLNTLPPEGRDLYEKVCSTAAILGNPPQGAKFRQMESEFNAQFRKK